MSNYVERLPVYAGAKSRCDSQSRAIVHRLFEPRTEPALGFLCALDDLLVELVHRLVDLLAGAAELLLGLKLGLLVLLPGLDAVLVELLLSLLCLGAGLVGLVESAMHQRLMHFWRHTYCCAFARTAS
jgi:hypothetical protein